MVSATILSVAACGDTGTQNSTPLPGCAQAGSPPITGSGGSTTPNGGTGAAPAAGGTVTTGTGGTTGVGATPGMGGTTPVGMGGTTGTGATGTGATPGMGGTPDMGGATGMGGTTGVAGTTGAGGMDQTPGPCPSGFMCTDLSMLGATATDTAGNPVTASCGMGTMQFPCDDANPKGSCPAALTNPICAHVSVAGLNLISCGQRCVP